MKKHKDLLTILRSNGMRITPARRVLLQYILDRRRDRLTLQEIQGYLDGAVPGVDRSSVYRNLEAFKRLEIIQELKLPGVGKCFQYVFDAKVHHFYICKVCGSLKRGNDELFTRIDRALREVHGFSKSKLSIVFYGVCSRCD